MDTQQAKRIVINIETQDEFSTRASCINPSCNIPLPMGLVDTLCFKCQKEQNAHSQAEIDVWRLKHLEPYTKNGAISIEDYLNNLIHERDNKFKNIKKTPSKIATNDNGSTKAKNILNPRMPIGAILTNN